MCLLSRSVNAGLFYLQNYKNIGLFPAFIPLRAGSERAAYAPKNAFPISESETTVTTTGPLWHITLFGSLRVSLEEQDPHAFGAHGAGRLLAYLACYPNRACRRDELAERFWPDAPERAAHNLSQALYALRQRLDTPAARGVLPFPLTTDRETLRLNSACVQTDKQQFEACLQAAQQTENEDEITALLQKAVALYRGDFLPEFAEEWAETERRGLNDAYANALKQLTKLLVKAGKPDAALEYARRTLRLDPFDETQHRNLMKLYLAAHRPRAALRQYQELVTLLRREFQQSPSGATEALAQSIAAKIAAPTHESLLLADSETFRDSPPGTQARRPAPGVWPAATRRFFGRRDEIQQLRERMDTPECRLLTLTGPPGCGKTHLALAVAQQLREEFRDLVLYVPLASLGSANDIHDAILEATGMPRTVSSDPLEQIIALLGSEPALMVLDNMEHLLPGGSSVVWTLLNLVPNLKCLVTSRHLLNLAQEREFLVATLPFPTQDGTPERLLEFASIQLFVDRAQAVKPNFHLTTENSRTIVSLCQRLNGIPLAIELAATWIKLLSPAQILKAQIQHLTTPQVDVPERQRSLAAALDWSVRLLSEDSQRLFASLSVFRRGWDMDAAQSLCDTPSVLRCLAELSEHSLLEVDDSGIESRYFLLESIREHAEERLSVQEKRTVGQRHALYFMNRAEENEKLLYGKDAPLGFDWMQREHDNLRTALRFSLETRDAELGMRLGVALWRFWLNSGFLIEGQGWLDQLLAAFPQADVVRRHRILHGAGYLAKHNGELETAQRYVEQAYAIRQELDDRKSMAGSLLTLSIITRAMHSYEHAMRLSRQAVDLAARENDAHYVALTQGELASCLTQRGEYAEAMSLHNDNLPYFRAQERLFDLCTELNNTVNTLLCADRPEDIPPYLEEAITIACRMDNASYKAHSLMNYVGLAMKQQQVQRAARLLGAFRRTTQAIKGGRDTAAEEEYNRYVAASSETLGQTEYQSLWQEGLTMHDEEILRYALTLEE